MSKRDYLENKQKLKVLRGKPIRYIAATNSLKFQSVFSSGRGNPYLWIDPSWSLYKREKLIVGSYEYPDHNKGLYLINHRIWGRKLKMLHGQILLSLSQCDRDTTVFKFSGGYELYSFSNQLDDFADDYDDWYVGSIT